MKQLLLIYNPRSGHGMIGEKLAQTIDYLTKNGYLVTAYPTQGGYDFAPLLPEAQKADRLIYAGGDGMLNAALNFQLSNRLEQPIGYIPAGTTNDFARSLGLGDEYMSLLQTAISGAAQSLDAGMLNQHYFMYVAAFGVFSEISYTTPQENKNRIGYAAYLLEGAKNLSDLTAHRLQVRYRKTMDAVPVGKIADTASMEQADAETAEDGMKLETIEGDFAFGMITNSYSVAGFRNLSPAKISLTDGLFEVTLVRYPQNLAELRSVVHALLSGKEETDRLLRFQTDSLRISGREPLAWCMDGEYGGSFTETEIRSLQNAVRVRVKETELSAGNESGS